MTHRLDAVRRHDVAARWCALAEQRLEFLTELFESGRWRRYHSELSFLENIQEAKAAVEAWRDLSRHEAVGDTSSVRIAWPARPRTAQILDNKPLDDMMGLRPQAPAEAAEPPGELAAVADVADATTEGAASLPAAAEPHGAAEATRDLDGIQARYPILRNAL